LRIFQDQTVKGEFSPDSAFLYTYGMYLANGGTVDGFMDLSEEDVEIMHTALMGTQLRQRNELIEGFAKILSKMFGGEE